MIRFACPSCAAIYTVGDEKGGKTGKCPKCQSQFVIPAAPVAAEDYPPIDPPAPPPPPPAPLSFQQPPPPPPPPPVSEPAMAEEVNTVEIQPCPKCGAKLSVEGKDVGLDIECPHCQTVFRALAAGSVPPPPPGGSVGEGKGTSKLIKLGSGTKRGKGKDDDDDDDDDRKRKKKKYRRDDDDDDEDDDDDDDDEEEKRPKKRKTRRTYSRPRGTVSIVRLSVLRYGITSALVCMFMGLIVSLIYGLILLVVFGCFGAMFSSASGSNGGNAMGGLAMLGAVGVVYWLFLLLVYVVGGFIVGFIGGIIFAAVYNMVAKWTGGIEMELE